MQQTAWFISGAVFVVAVAAWGQTYSWNFESVSVYQIFPLLGLTAFSLMWAHYVAAALRQHSGLDKAVLKQYFEITSAVVLVCILLHPALLEWQLWRDGLGFPPSSLKAYVGVTGYWAIWLGLTAWLIFISYELRRFFAGKKWWPLVQYASDAAMLLILIHAWKLGGAMSLTWFKVVWVFYGLSLALVLAYSYGKKLTRT